MANSILQEKIKSLKSPNSGSKQKRKQSHTKCENGVQEIEVDSDTESPTTAWGKLSEFNPAHELPTDMYLAKPRDGNSLRFVCMSDTHGVIESGKQNYHERIPDGDVLIHSGDFTMRGSPNEITRFDRFISKLPHPVKLVIAGNHELTFELGQHFGSEHSNVRKELGLPVGASNRDMVAACKALLEHMLYLEEESIDICGVKLYGSPWVPQFGTWGFSERRGDHLLEKWNKIPSETDILITHGPPCGYGDLVRDGRHRAGCVELLNTVVKRVKPKFHVFGHLHNNNGMWSNGKTIFINSSVCNNSYHPKYDPVVFDYPLPAGYSREDFMKLSTESLRQTVAEARTQNQLNRKVSEAADSVTEAQLATERAQQMAAENMNDVLAQLKGVKL